MSLDHFLEKKETPRQLQESNHMKYHLGTYGQPRDEEPEGSLCHGTIPK